MDEVEVESKPGTYPNLDDVIVEDDGPSLLLPCIVCNKTFKPEVLQRHSKVCEKNASKKRKTFDSFKQRVQGTDLAEFLPFSMLQKRTSTVSEKLASPKKVSSRWKENHEAFVSAIRAARGEEPDAVGGSGDSRSLLRPPDHDQCPYCERHFGKKAFDRHQDWCREHHSRHPPVTASSQAKERLEARIKYRAPPIKSKRAMTREKYSPLVQRKVRQASPTSNSNLSSNSTSGSATSSAGSTRHTPQSQQEQSNRLTRSGNSLSGRSVQKDPSSTLGLNRGMAGRTSLRASQRAMPRPTSPSKRSSGNKLPASSSHRPSQEDPPRILDKEDMTMNLKRHHMKNQPSKLLDTKVADSPKVQPQKKIYPSTTAENTQILPDEVNSKESKEHNSNCRSLKNEHLWRQGCQAKHSRYSLPLNPSNSYFSASSSTDTPRGLSIEKEAKSRRQIHSKTSSVRVNKCVTEMVVTQISQCDAQHSSTIFKTSSSNSRLGGLVVKDGKKSHADPSRTLIKDICLDVRSHLVPEIDTSSVGSLGLSSSETPDSSSRSVDSSRTYITQSSLCCKADNVYNHEGCDELGRSWSEANLKLSTKHPSQEHSKLNFGNCGIKAKETSNSDSLVLQSSESPCRSDKTVTSQILVQAPLDVSDRERSIPRKRMKIFLSCRNSRKAPNQQSQVILPTPPVAPIHSQCTQCFDSDCYAFCRKHEGFFLPSPHRSENSECLRKERQEIGMSLPPVDSNCTTWLDIAKNGCKPSPYLILNSHSASDHLSENKSSDVQIPTQGFLKPLSSQQLNLKSAQNKGLGVESVKNKINQEKDVNESFQSTLKETLTPSTCKGSLCYCVPHERLPQVNQKHYPLPFPTSKEEKFKSFQERHLKKSRTGLPNFPPFQCHCAKQYCPAHISPVHEGFRFASNLVNRNAARIRLKPLPFNFRTILGGHVLPSMYSLRLIIGGKRIGNLQEEPYDPYASAERQMMELLRSDSACNINKKHQKSPSPAPSISPMPSPTLSPKPSPLETSPTSAFTRYAKELESPVKIGNQSGSAEKSKLIEESHKGRNSPLLHCIPSSTVGKQEKDVMPEVPVLPVPSLPQPQPPPRSNRRLASLSHSKNVEELDDASEISIEHCGLQSRNSLDSVLKDFDNASTDLNNRPKTYDLDSRSKKTIEENDSLMNVDEQSSEGDFKFPTILDSADGGKVEILNLDNRDGKRARHETRESREIREITEQESGIPNIDSLLDEVVRMQRSVSMLSESPISSVGTALPASQTSARSRRSRAGKMHIEDFLFPAEFLERENNNFKSSDGSNTVFGSTKSRKSSSKGRRLIEDMLFPPATDFNANSDNNEDGDVVVSANALKATCTFPDGFTSNLDVFVAHCPTSPVALTSKAPNIDGGGDDHLPRPKPLSLSAHSSTRNGCKDGFDKEAMSVPANSMQPTNQSHQSSSRLSADSAYSSLNRRSPVGQARQQSCSGQPDVNRHRAESPHSLLSHSLTQSLVLSSSGSESSLPPLMASQLLKRGSRGKHDCDTPSSDIVSATTPLFPKLSKFCHQCGTKFLISVSKFCHECGAARLEIC